jgi:hypothetical protein
MSFRIRGLPAAPFAPLFDLDDTQLAQRGVLRCAVDSEPGFPCRISLRDAPLQAQVLLLNYEHLPVATPYRSRHAIYVCPGAPPAQLADNEIPDMLARRLLSLRAFDGAGMMVDADVLEGAALAQGIRRMFDGAATQYLHVHFAKRGCYAARVERSA